MRLEWPTAACTVEKAALGWATLLASTSHGAVQITMSILTARVKGSAKTERKKRSRSPSAHSRRAIGANVIDVSAPAGQHLAALSVAREFAALDWPLDSV